MGLEVGGSVGILDGPLLGIPVGTALFVGEPLGI